MKKRTFISDTFEKLDLGEGAKKAVKPLTEMPEKMMESVLGLSHTPLDLEKLKKNYKKQDEQKTTFLRQRLFQLAKSGEEKVLWQKKQAELEQQRKEALAQQEKKRQEEQKKKRVGPIPLGRIRKSIFTPLKMAKRQTAEVRPASGKQ